MTISKIDTVVSKSQYESICDALRQLNFRCNGAINEDGIGFNKGDSFTGKSYVAFIDRGGQLTESEQLAALIMLQKYRKQLERYGVDLPTVDTYAPKPLPTVGPTLNKPATQAAPVAANPQLILIDYNGFNLVVTFKYNEAIKNLISSLPKDQRRFEKFPEPRWVVDPSLLNELINRLPTATLTPSAQKLSDSVPQVTPVATPVVTPVTTPKQVTDADVVVKLNGSSLIITFPFSNEIREKIKTLQDWKPDKTTNPWGWIVPARHAEAVCKLFPQAQIDPAIAGMIEGVGKLVEKANAETSDFDVPLLTGQLMPFQRAGVEYIESAGGNGIIGDDMGLGKTIQAIAYLQLHPEQRPAVIICPASIKLNWAKEIEKFMIDAKRTHVISGTKNYKLPSADIYIINYDIAGNWQETLCNLRPEVLILDEAHRIKANDKNKKGEFKTKRVQACHEIGKASVHKILLTGTPILNRHKEFWSLLHLIAPQDWPNFFSYARRYCGAKQTRFGWDYEGSTNGAELYQKAKPYMIRRRKQDVLKDLPDRRIVRINVEMTPEFREAYEEALTQAEQEIARKAKGGEALAMIEKAKQITLAAKMPAVLEWIADFIEGDNKLVAFAAHREATEKVYEEFKTNAVKIIGGLSDQQRQDAKDTFQTDPNVKLFVGNHQAAGEGITLTAASDLLFYEFPWTPGMYRQCRDRIHRIGQKNACTIYNFVCTNTIDEDILNLLEKKAAIVDQAVDGAANVDIGASIVDDLIKLMLGSN